ncbi:hypothetical protein L209DRAFT_742607 [Thermothelomyces heterothallicus CBS 203.75]
MLSLAARTMLRLHAFYIQDRGNNRRPLPRNHSDNYKVNVAYGTRRWKAFCEFLCDKPAWKDHLKTPSWKEQQGSCRSFCPVLNAKAKRAEAQESPRPSGFTYLAHFRWVRDWKTTFKIGLDRLDDSLIRDILMWTGCRRHELVYAQMKNVKVKVKEYDEESDAYTDVDNDSDLYVEQRPKNFLCWEDINLWILRDPMGDGGRDRLGMQVLLRFHKGHNKEILPTWFPFVEEKLPLLCPISKLLAKALAEGVVDLRSYGARPEPYFNTKMIFSIAVSQARTSSSHQCNR